MKNGKLLITVSLLSVFVLVLAFASVHIMNRNAKNEDITTMGGEQSANAQGADLQTSTQPPTPAEQPTPPPEPAATPAPEKTEDPLPFAPSATKTPKPQGQGTPAPTDAPKYVYLTFDDGPCKNTPKVLDILKEYNVKATFFVIGNQISWVKDIMEREYDEGHAIGVHSMTHDRPKIYKTQKALFDDIDACTAEIRKHLGDKFETGLYRFPGGSISKLAKPYRYAVVEAGYTYYDWTVDSGDTSAKLVPADTIVKNIEKSRLRNEEIVLMHDGPGKDTLVDALPRIIEYYREKGYEFRTLMQRVDSDGKLIGYSH